MKIGFISFVLLFCTTITLADTNVSDEYSAELSFDRENRIAVDGGSGWYFAPHVGLNLIANTSKEGFTVSFDNGIAFGGGFGIDLQKDLSFQFDFGFIRNDIDLITNDASGATSAPDVEYSQIPLICNLVWTPSNQPDLRPYFGVGAGAIRGKYESNTFVSSNAEWALAVRVQVGAKIDLSTTSNLSFGYQFMLAQYDDDIDNHTIGIGLRFKF